MDIVATLAVVEFSVWAFLRIFPAGADVARVRQFNRRALAYLTVLCAIVLGLFVARAKPLELSLLAAELFFLIFVPFYLGFAGLLWSRLLTAFHRGGGSTV